MSTQVRGVVLWRGRERSAYRNPNGQVWFFYAAEDLTTGYRLAGRTVAATFKAF